MAAILLAPAGSVGRATTATVSFGATSHDISMVTQYQQRQEDKYGPHAVEREVESLGNQWWHLSFLNSSKSRDYLITHDPEFVDNRVSKGVF